MIRRLIRLTVAASAATGIVGLYVAAARWRDLHLAACRRIVELERLLRHERRQVDGAEERIEALVEKLRKARAKEGGLVTLSREALTMATDRIDALTEELRAGRSGPLEMTPWRAERPETWVDQKLKDPALRALYEQEKARREIEDAIAEEEEKTDHG